MSIEIDLTTNALAALDEAMSKGPLAELDERAELTMDAENVPEKLMGDVQ